MLVAVWSWHPQNRPGVLHSAVECDAEVKEAVEVSSLQPNHPGVSQLVVGDSVCFVLVAVTVGTVVLDLLVVVVSSLQPNHPGVLHVDVDVVVVVLLVVVPVVVVVSSKHPHHPGVLQVEVRVFVLVVEEEVVDVLVLFPVTSFHKGQS